MARIPRRQVLRGAAAGAVGVALTQARTDLAGAAPARETRPSCTTPGAEDFPKVGGNYGNQNYSALDRIHHGNVRRLGAAWVNRIEGGLTTGTNQSTAVAVDGVLYIESALGNVFAVDGRTGVTKWVYRQTRGAVTRRGVAVGPDKVFTHGQGNWIIALDQATGAVVWERQINDYGNMEKVALTYYDGLLHVGTHDGDRGAALAVDAATGDLVWHFWGAPGPGELGNDTWEGDSCLTGGATPWMHPALDPELGLVYWTFGNARGSNSSQDGSQRGGMNLFSSSIVAMDIKTGQYRWHFQSIHHGIWDMDNVMAPVLADVRIRGRLRKVVVYGSKSGMYFILDRTDGSAPLGIDERPVPQDPRQKTWPTQPFPRQGGWTEIAGRGPAAGHLGAGRPQPGRAQLRAGRAVRPALGRAGAVHPRPRRRRRLEPPVVQPQHRAGLHRLRLRGRRALADRGQQRPAPARRVPDRRHRRRRPSTNKVRWKKRMPYSLAHGNGILTTASDLLFIGQPDGNLLGLDARNGHELWRFQTGAAISSSPIMYEVDGVQYLAVYAGGTSIPYGDSAPRGDFLWAFKIGGNVAAAPTPPPPVVRRPVSGGPVEGSVVNNTVVLARTYNATTGAGRYHRVDRGQRDGADPHARAGRHHGHVRQPGRQRQRARCDAVLRRAVRRPAQARRTVLVHVPAPGRILLQRLLQPTPDRKDRSLLTA